MVRRVEQTEASKDYLMLESMVEHLYQPLWHKEAAIWGFLALILIWAHSTSCFALSVVLFGVQQIITGWESHSAAHSRNKNLMALGTVNITTNLEIGSLARWIQSELVVTKTQYAPHVHQLKIRW